MYHVENLRAKPEHIRKRFAFIVSFSISFIIFAGWIGSYGFKTSAVATNKDNSVEAPISSLRASVIGAYNDIKFMIVSSNKKEYSSDNLEVVPGSK